MTVEPDQPLGNDSVDLVYFFVPLVEPLALPDGACQRFGERFSYEDWAAAIEAGRAVPFDTVKRLTSLMFRQTTVQDFSLLGVAPAFRVALEAFPTLANSVHEPTPTTLPKTVIEAAVQLLPYDGDAPSQEVINEALNTALRCIQRVQRAYRFVTTRPVTLITRERMPPFIPMALRLGINPIEAPSWPDDIEPFPT